jgi:DNA/RNA endonuclease YhcR with UshA esterase domain
MVFSINLDRSKQITLLILLLAIVGLAAINFAVQNIRPIELEIGAIEESMEGKLVKVSGNIENIRKSKSGNLYWSISDGNNITVPLLDGKFKKIVAKRGDTVEIIGLVSKYNGELEIMPREITLG